MLPSTLRAPRNVVLAIAALALAGCPSKEGEAKDAQAPLSPSGQASVGAGPLAALETSTSASETWTGEDGSPQAVLHFTKENVRLSASCKKPSGELACDAVRTLRGAPVAISKKSLDGRQSAGVKVCQELKFASVTLHDGSGNEDSFCRFADGSLVSSGALEQYAMTIAP